MIKLKRKAKRRLIFVMVFILGFTLKTKSGVNLSNDAKTQKVVLKQLNFLEQELKQDSLGDRMQKMYPEGFVFINALYGLTWCELALNYNLDSTTKEKAFNEAHFAYNEINSDRGKAIFNKNLHLPYGAYYNGWKNYLLGKIIAFHKVSPEDSASFMKNCSDIDAAISTSVTPYLESYSLASWPADVLPCIASLKLYDALLPQKYENTRRDWLVNVKMHLDTFTGLIPHATQASSGETIEGARGSSISLILRILSEIDPTFAKEQFTVYKEFFQIYRLGVPAIREYPKGKKGKGDIDSGPVIMGVGFAGTIVSIGVYKTFGELDIANRTSDAMESYGVSYSVNKRKRYVFGALPIADAFIAWSRSAPQVNKDILPVY